MYIIQHRLTDLPRNLSTQLYPARCSYQGAFRSQHMFEPSYLPLINLQRSVILPKVICNSSVYLHVGRMHPQRSSVAIDFKCQDASVSLYRWRGSMIRRHTQTVMTRERSRIFFPSWSVCFYADVRRSRKWLMWRDTFSESMFISVKPPGRTNFLRGVLDVESSQNDLLAFKPSVRMLFSLTHMGGGFLSRHHWVK